MTVMLESGPAEPALPHNDRGAEINIVLWVLVVLSTIFVGMRVFCKRWTGKSLWWDDYTLMASWVCFVADAAFWTLAVGQGFGKHTWDFPMQNIEKTGLFLSVAGIFALTAIIWSKTSFAVTLLRLTTGRTRAFVWFLLITTNVFLGLSALFNMVQCRPIEKAWRPMVDGTCWDMRTLINYHIFSGVYSAVVDFSLALLPWPLVLGMSLRRSEKFGIAVAMSMGIL